MLNVANKPFMMSVVMLNVVAASIRLIGDLLSWFSFWPKLYLHMRLCSSSCCHAGKCNLERWKNSNLSHIPSDVEFQCKTVPLLLNIIQGCRRLSVPNAPTFLLPKFSWCKVKFYIICEDIFYLVQNLHLKQMGKWRHNTQPNGADLNDIQNNGTLH